MGLVAFVEGGNDCANGWSKSVLVQNTDLNHGLAIQGSTIYASSVDNVFRYTINWSNRSVSSPETIIQGMNLAQNHKTRTLELYENWILVSGGASGNLEDESVDASHGTAQIRRFALNGTVPSGGYRWFDGELVSFGMRNAVGITMGADGRHLWTVENSADQLNYTSGGNLVDIHKDNPSEELNVVDMNSIGNFYGYPNCFTAWDMGSVVSGTSLATGDQFSIVPNVTDAQCGNTTYNTPPRLSMQAHSAPLDIQFYKADGVDENVAVTKDWNTHAFVSFHGSWNRDPPTGYGIVRIPWSGNEPSAKADAKDGYSFILQASDLAACPNGCFRPVGLAFDSRGRLFGTSDTTGELFVIHKATAASAALRMASSSTWFIIITTFMAAYVIT